MDIDVCWPIGLWILRYVGPYEVLWIFLFAGLYVGGWMLLFVGRYEDYEQRAFNPLFPMKLPIC